jgi:hypothetical protein
MTAEQQGHTPARFTIAWLGSRFHVSIPNYQGGEVMRAEIADELLETLRPFTFCNAETPPEGVSVYDWKRAIVAAQAAIKKAEGQS